MYWDLDLLKCRETPINHSSNYWYCLFMHRLGGGEEDVAEITRHAFFSCINWQDLVDKKV